MKQFWVSRTLLQHADGHCAQCDHVLFAAGVQVGHQPVGCQEGKDSPAQEDQAKVGCGAQMMEINLGT
jgi:hypothetical protein